MISVGSGLDLPEIGFEQILSRASPFDQDGLCPGPRPLMSRNSANRRRLKRVSDLLVVR